MVVGDSPRGVQEEDDDNVPDMDALNVDDESEDEVPQQPPNPPPADADAHAAEVAACSVLPVLKHASEQHDVVYLHLSQQITSTACLLCDHGGCRRHCQWRRRRGARAIT